MEIDRIAHTQVLQDEVEIVSIVRPGGAHTIKIERFVHYSQEVHVTAQQRLLDVLCLLMSAQVEFRTDAQFIVQQLQVGSRSRELLALQLGTTEQFAILHRLALCRGPATQVTDVLHSLGIDHMHPFRRFFD